MRFADTALDIRTETRLATGEQHADVTVPVGTIRSLERPRDSSRNGVLIGAGVGAGVSLGMFIHAAAVDYNEIDEWGPMYLAMGAELDPLPWISSERWIRCPAWCLRWPVDESVGRFTVFFLEPVS